MTSALLLLLFAVLRASTAIGDKQANIPVRHLNNGTPKNSASYAIPAQYSNGNYSARLTPVRPAQNSVVGSSYSAKPMGSSYAEQSTARPAAANVEESAAHKTVNSSVSVQANPTATQMRVAQAPPLPQQTITNGVTYPASLISAQIAAASLTTASPVTYVKQFILQPTAAPSIPDWQLQHHAPIDRSYSVVNPIYTDPVASQLSSAAPINSNWDLQLHTPNDRSYSAANPMRYYPYNTLRQSTLVEPHIDKRNQKYKHYSLYHTSHQSPQHFHSAHPAHTVHSQPANNYYSNRMPIERENPPFFKPHPTKYVHFHPQRFPSPYNGLLGYSRYKPSYKDNPFAGSSPGGSMYYKILFPLALLGISIPAIGMMYTYLSKRRRRRSVDDPYPSTEDVEYYMQMLRKAVELYQQNDITSHDKYS